MMFNAPAIPRGTTDYVLRRMFPQPDPYNDDPVGWVNNRLGEHLWSKQREIAESVRDNRYTAVQSAHDTGKSFIASRLVAWWMSTHPIGEAFAVTTAPTQTQVETILWREIGRAHRKGNLDGRITAGMVPQWKIGPEIVGYGRKPQDLRSVEEAAAAFSGIHAKYVLIVIDEGGGVPKWLFDAVDTLATNEYARVLAIGNPDDPVSNFERICRPGSGWDHHTISAFDTPAFTGEDVPDDLLDLLVSRTWVEERKVDWGEGSPLYISKVLGEFPEVTDDTLISPAMVREAQLRELPGMEKGKFGADIARYGTDETCVYRNRGGCIRLEHTAHKKSTMESTGVFAKLIEDTSGEVPMIVDVIGIGAGPYDRLVEMGYPVRAFDAAERAYNPKRFKNRRAEAWWGMRTLFEEGMIDIAAADEKLAAQLLSIKWKVDSAGRIYIESKDDMKKRGLPSPDRADAAMMSTVVPPNMHIPELDPEDKVESLTADLLKRDM